MNKKERPKHSLVPVITTEDDRERVIRELSDVHGYSIWETSYILNVTKRTVYRWIAESRVEIIVRMGKPVITGHEIRRVFFS